MKKKFEIEELSKHLFWDFNIEKMDININRTIIIERVFNIGDIDDLHKIIEYYGLQTIRNEIVKAGFLDKKTINFASKFLNIDLIKFKCYSKIQSQQIHWNF